MKKTKTIEVEICDQCGAEVEASPNGRHLKTCPACKKEFCPNCEKRFDVTIREVTPFYYEPTGRYGSSTQTKASHETGFTASYCSQCGHGIEANLIAAGLKKFPVKKSRGDFEKD